MADWKEAEHRTVTHLRRASEAPSQPSSGVKAQVGSVGPTLWLEPPGHNLLGVATIHNARCRPPFREDAEAAELPSADELLEAADA